VQLPGLGHVNCYLLEDERGVAVIDPGLPGPDSWNALVSRLDAAGYEVRNVHTAVITHSHFDHFGGANQLRDEAGCDVLTHESFRNAFDMHELGENPDTEFDINDEEASLGSVNGSSRKTPWGTHWTPPTDGDLRRMLKHGRGAMQLLPEPSIRVIEAQVVRLARREWIAVHTPGHTGDHLCLFDPEQGLFVSGDHVLPTITPHIAGVATRPTRSPRSSLRCSGMHDFEVTTVLPAPRSSLSRSRRARRRHRAASRRAPRHLAQSSAAANCTSARSPSSCATSSKERAWGDMAESETFAHLEHLRLLGEATVTEIDGLLAYAIKTDCPRATQRGSVSRPARRACGPRDRSPGGSQSRIAPCRSHL
jgi:glyoxylase-like metal-dependent hydrolase (beta-lactamase superfamily II)